MKAILFALIFFTSTLSFSQQIKWEKIVGGDGYDYGYSVIQTYDSGYVVVGSTTTFGNGNMDAYILKTDERGTPLWQKNIGGISIEKAYSVKETNDSGLVIAGYTNSFGNGGYDMYVIKTNKYGDTIWTKTYGGSEWDFAYSIEQTNDGGYIIAGGTYSFGKGNEDMYLVKTDANGDTLWTKTYGGMNDDEAKSLKQTSDGGYILTGFTKSFGDSNGDIYTIKTNSTGDTLWTKTLGYDGFNEATEIIQTSDGGYLSSGVSAYTTGGYNVSILIKTDALGDTIFTRKNGFPNDAASNTICESNDGGYVWAGKLKLGSNYDIYFFKYDALGNYVFSYTFGSTKDEEAMSLKQTFDHGYIIAGNSNSFNNYLGDIYLIKTDSMGLSSGTISRYSTGINTYSIESNSLTIYPNPSYNGQSILILNNAEAIKSSEIKLTIYNATGQIVTTETYKTSTSLIRNELPFNTTALKNGMYFVEIIFDNKKISSKLIIENN